LEAQKALKAAGVDEVLVYCVNDGAVMGAWAKNQGVEGSMITFLGDTRQVQIGSGGGLYMPPQLDDMQPRRPHPHARVLQKSFRARGGRSPSAALDSWLLC
jgi:hypothetical protein